MLREQLGIDEFAGGRADRWPATTIPAHNLAVAAYDVDVATGLAVSVALRTALFEEGRDIGDLAVLADIAAEHGVTADISAEASDAVRAGYDAGVARGVTGSPHFWVGDDNFFCPALTLGHDAGHHLTASFDAAALDAFFARIDV